MTPADLKAVLALRPWALAAVAGRAAAPPRLPSPGAWRAFLRVERCAAPLRRALSAANVPLPPELAAILADLATAELKRFMSAAAQVLLAGSLLRDMGVPGVALKAGAGAAGGGEPVDVADLDLLVPAEHAARFAAALEARGGHRPLKADPPATATGKWEMAGRKAQGALLVEVHFAVPHLGPGVDPWSGLRPTRVAGVFRLSAAHHLWHLLVHSAVHHVERRGQIRELVLLREAIGAATPAEVEEVRARAAAHPAAAVLQASLEMAGELAGGRVPRDRFAGVAAARAALLDWTPPPGVPAPTVRAYTAAVVALAAGAGDYRRLWFGADFSALAPSGFRGARALDVLPPLAWLVRTGWRSGHLALATLPALRLARTALRAADHAG